MRLKPIIRNVSIGIVGLFTQAVCIITIGQYTPVWNYRFMLWYDTVNLNNKYKGLIMNIGFLGLLTLIFITLKLTNFITWSWWWVLAPSWVFLAFFIVVMFILAIIKIIKGVLK